MDGVQKFLERKGYYIIPLGLACKLASVVVHADEASGPDAHHFDLGALKTVVDDAEVKAWLLSLGPLAPVKRRKA